METIGVVTKDPATGGALRTLTELGQSAELILSDLTPAQVTCNVIPLWARGVGGSFGGLGFGNGPGVATVGLGLANFGAKGETMQSPKPASNIGMNYVAHNNADLDLQDQRADGRDAKCGQGRTSRPSAMERAMTPSSSGNGEHPIEELDVAMGSREHAAAQARRRSIAATIAVVGFLVITVAVFVKDNPFSNPYEIRALFKSATQLRDGSAVRLAGLDAGSVTHVEAGPHGGALVTMEITDPSVQIFRNARLAIAPRLALEGNFYVNVDPGSSAQPELADGETLPLIQTSVPVQLDQALGVFRASVRESLATTVHEFGAGLGPAAEGEPAKGKGGHEAKATTQEGRPYAKPLVGSITL
jgi:hypothetical protein